MNDPIDSKLSALFRGVDTRPGFNERLLDRLRQEVAAEARRTEEARRREQLRHRVAKSGHGIAACSGRLRGDQWRT